MAAYSQEFDIPSPFWYPESETYPSEMTVVDPDSIPYFEDDGGSFLETMYPGLSVPEHYSFDVGLFPTSLDNQTIIQDTIADVPIEVMDIDALLRDWLDLDEPPTGSTTIPEVEPTDNMPIDPPSTSDAIMVERELEFAASTTLTSPLEADTSSPGAGQADYDTRPRQWLDISPIAGYEKTSRIDEAEFPEPAGV
ncbi:hypothetical protein NKR23_g12452 [Pleurostoma richardsiae]|uniref:Uncharacterized protein n=1 Tax=Pleurostoma richardsiae TaxID=41990 RepID=A0AA38R934_9PEZI|nr:hypothetical protein NKR23_g12452 [Pleurostoma richardsiae]